MVLAGAAEPVRVAPHAVVAERGRSGRRLLGVAQEYGRLGQDRSKWQKILNQDWPANARVIRDQAQPIPVRARIVWERDGEEWIEGRAVRWTRSHVFVAFGDERWQVLGVWLRPGDVRRR